MPRAAAGDDPCQAWPLGPQDERARLLAWLASGARELAWALCSLPRERWLEPPPDHVARTTGGWPALRHVRHVSLYAAQLWLPAVQAALGQRRPEQLAPIVELERQDAAWDARSAAADALVRSLAETRFELLRLLESAPDDAWARPLAPELADRGTPRARPARLGWLVARAYQHELEHLSALWKLALYWDRAPAPPSAGADLPLQPADRMEPH